MNDLSNFNQSDSIRFNQSDSVRLSLPDKPQFISLARMAASMMANLAGMSYDVVQDIKIALSEACTNALRYGCTNDDHYVVEMFLDDGWLNITVTDTGEGYDFSLVQEPDIGNQVGGFGLFIIRSLMDKTEIKSEKGQGTSITIRKSVESSNGNEKRVNEV